MHVGIYKIKTIFGLTIRLIMDSFKITFQDIEYIFLLKNIIYFQYNKSNERFILYFVNGTEKEFKLSNKKYDELIKNVIDVY